MFLGRVCVRLGFKPNVLTVLSVVCSIVAGIFFWKQEMLWGVFWILMTAITDMLDGSTARAGNLGTVFGGISDHVLDRYGEFFILAGITLSGAVHPGWGLFALFGMLVASYTRATAESIGKRKLCRGNYGEDRKIYSHHRWLHYRALSSDRYLAYGRVA